LHNEKEFKTPYILLPYLSGGLKLPEFINFTAEAINK
jgi:hypothetical protein